MVPETTNRRDSVFAPGEIGRIIIAWVVLSLAISLSYVGGLPQTTSDYLDIVAAFIATATGFILHEMGHKFTALRLGYTAQFRIWPVGIALTLITAVLTRGQFIFGAPGAVYIAPAVGLGALGYSMTRSRNEDHDNMLISAAGPGVNLVLAVFFLLLILVSPATGFLSTVATYGFQFECRLRFIQHAADSAH